MRSQTKLTIPQVTLSGKYVNLVILAGTNWGICATALGSCAHVFHRQYFRYSRIYLLDDQKSHEMSIFQGHVPGSSQSTRLSRLFFLFFLFVVVDAVFFLHQKVQNNLVLGFRFRSNSRWWLLLVASRKRLYSFTAASFVELLTSSRDTHHCSNTFPGRHPLIDGNMKRLWSLVFQIQVNLALSKLSLFFLFLSHLSFLFSLRLLTRTASRHLLLLVRKTILNDPQNHNERNKIIVTQQCTLTW